MDYFPSASSVEEEVDAREAAETIDKYLETLDQQSRIMFVRRYWHSDSIGDLAKLFHISKHAAFGSSFPNPEKPKEIFD